MFRGLPGCSRNRLPRENEVMEVCIHKKFLS